MFFKNWPYWLKGGIIMGIVFVTWFFVTYMVDKANCSPVTCGLGTAVINFPSVLVVEVFLLRAGFFSVLGKIFGANTSEVIQFSFIPIVNFIIGFLLGAIAGSIYGKIKNKK